MASSRNLIIMLLSIEAILVSASLVGTSIFSASGNGSIVLFLISVWGIASVEIIALVAIYHYITREEGSMDVTKLSKLKG
ncbi:MAG: hypothetical protein QXN59_01700 [Candidatus Micrarchaeaceae archaeon]